MLRRLLIVALAIGSAHAADRTTPLPAAQVNAAYKVQLGFPVRAGDVYPFTFTYQNLPDWLNSLPNPDLEKGLIGGTPAPADVGDGPVTFNAIVTDAAGHRIGSFPFSIAVKPTPTVLVVVAGTPRGSPAPSVPAPPAAPVAPPAPAAPGAPAAPAVAPAPPAPPPPAAPPNFTIASDDAARIAPGGSLTFTAKATSTAAGAPGTLPELQWAVTDPSAGDSIDPSSYSIQPLGSNQATLTLAPDAVAPSSERLSVIACPTGSTCPGPTAAALNIKVVDHPAGLMVIPVIGFEQVGASSAASTQKFFFDFFISRPFPLLQRKWEDCKKDDDCRILGPKLRLWGGVRIGSYPQQITSGVGEFATGFATQVAQLKVNQLAQGGEFNLGLEYRMRSFPWHFSSVESDSNERVSLGLVAGFGGISPFNPVDTLQIFQNPAAGSPQATAFFNQFPSSKGFTFTGFTTPDRDRFFWEYGAGIRLTVPFFDKANLQRSGPAMLTYMLGQNQLVSGGVSRGVVQRLEGFYPLPLGERFETNITTLYLFGRVDMRLASPHQTTPFILQPAPTTVNGFDPNVNIVALRSNRDIYTIGVGIDAVKLIKTITLQNTKTSSSAVKTPAPQP